tara:strand:+ start:946 stop:1281 length:336 start_codon:yes stop_codon:yes gene_type:complete
MGASLKTNEFKRKLNQNEIDIIVRLEQAIGAIVNGSEEPYTEDYQTIERIVLEEKELFKSKNEAEKYIMNNSQKWKYGVAVYYNEKNKKELIKGEDHDYYTKTLMGAWVAC